MHLAECKGDACDRTVQQQVPQSPPRPGTPSACAPGHAPQKLRTSHLGDQGPGEKRVATLKLDHLGKI